jgi:hypothetical protein
LAYAFDGPNRLIILSNGTTEVSVTDMYSRWKDWTIIGDNSKYLPAFSVLGGDPLPGGRFLGSTTFMENNWRIRPYEGDHVLTITGNIYDRDGANIMVPTVGNYNIQVIFSLSNLVDTVATGGSSGPTANQIATAVWEHASGISLYERTELAYKILRNKTITNPSNGRMIVFDDDGVTILLEANIYEDVNGSRPYRGQGAERRERLE